MRGIKLGKGNLVKVIVGAIAAIIVIVLCLGVTAMARERMAREERQRAYLLQKEETVRSVRSFLREEGYGNSGVTLTRREDGEEEEWILSVHHGSMDRLGEAEREELEGALSAVVKGNGNDVTVRVRIK